MKFLLACVALLPLGSPYRPTVAATHCTHYMRQEATPATAPEVPEIVVRFRKLVEALQAAHPLSAGFKLRVERIEGAAWGYTRRVPGGFDIAIDPRQSWSGLTDTLVHEWAHAMVWDATRSPKYRGHGPLWGVAYAEAYRTLLAEMAK